MGSTTVLVKGATRLGVDEFEIPNIKKKDCVLSKPFKAQKWRPRDAQDPVEERRMRRCGDTFRLDEGRACNPYTLRKFYDAELGCANLEVAYVQQTSIVPFDGR
jgi:hypothetical protein